MRIASVPVAVITLIWVVLSPVSAPAQTPQGLGVVTTLSGRASVARPFLSQPLPLIKDDVFERNRISTGSANSSETTGSRKSGENGR